MTVRNACLGALLLSGFAVPASAQYIVGDVIGATIGNMVASGEEHACMSGNVLPAKEIAEALTPSQAAMRRYVAAASASNSADVTSAFTRKAKLRAWVRNDMIGNIAAVDDPLARGAAGVLGEPTSFVRAGDGRSAVGVWTIVTGGAALGHYRVGFRRERKNWSITRLEITEGEALPVPVGQFCHMPGDVEPYLLRVAEYEAERERKRAEKAAAKAARNASRVSRP